MEINKTQYLKLLEAIYIGDQILQSAKGDSPEYLEYREAIQEYYSHAKDYGYENLIEEYKDGYDVTKDFHNIMEAPKNLNQYNNEHFWDELIERLARRDMATKHGKQVVLRLYKDKELLNELEQIKQQYTEHFKENGIKELKVL